jgi:hypothetical protein
MQLDLRRHSPAGVLHRAVVAQQFAYRAGQAFGFALQALPLIRMAKQRMQPVAQQVACRLMSGEQQHRALREQLGAALDLPALLGLQVPHAHNLVRMYCSAAERGPDAAIPHGSRRIPAESMRLFCATRC